MNRIIISILFTISCFQPRVKAFSLKPIINVNQHLAISINPNCNSQYVNYAIISESGGRIVKTRFITAREFILIGMGNNLLKQI